MQHTASTPGRRVGARLTLGLIAFVLALTLALMLVTARGDAQTLTVTQPPANLATLDSLRAEVVRLRGFVRAAETQATKAATAADRAAMLVEVVRMRGFVRSAETQAAKVLAALDSARASRPVVLPPPTDTIVPADTIPPPPIAPVPVPEPEPPVVVVPDAPTTPDTSPRAVELPHHEYRPAYPTRTGRTLTVPAGGSVQAAVDSAVLGDEIVLEAGATFTGTVRLPRKTTGSGWIVIRGSALDSLPAGARVTPAAAPLLPRLVAGRTTERVILTEAAAHHYWLAGLHVTSLPLTKRTLGSTLIELGIPSDVPARRELLPHSLVLDRMLIMPDSLLDSQRCVALHSDSTMIRDSWIAECHGAGFDSQAIGGWSGQGPYLIENNHLAGAGENIMFGGSDPRIKDRDSTGTIVGGTLPEDIVIRRNHFYKPPSWKNSVWTVKNLFELKIGRRVLLEGNVFEHNWGGGQTGYAWVLKSTNQGGTAPWSETSHVTARYNIIRNSAHGISIVSQPESKPVVPAHSFHLAHNWLERIGTSGTPPGDYAGGRVLFLSGIDNLTVERNTLEGSHSLAILSGTRMARFVMRGNLGVPTTYGLSGNGSGYGAAALSARAAAGWTFEGNVLPGVNTRTHTTAGNVYPTRASVTGLTLEALAALYPQAGADVAALLRMTAGVVVGMDPEP